ERGVLVQSFVDHRPQRAHLVHGRIVVEERPRPFVGRFITAEMLWRIRHGVDMWLRAVGRREGDVVTGIDQGHDRDDQLVEILAGGCGSAPLHLDPGCVGADDEHCSLRHKSSCYCVRWLPVHDVAASSACCAVGRPAADPTFTTALPTMSPARSLSRYSLIWSKAMVWIVCLTFPLAASSM